MEQEKFAVRTEHLTKIFRDEVTKVPVTALENLHLSIPAGKMTALTGPDGAGKTTCLRLICGLLSPTEGRVEVLGRDVEEKRDEVQSLLGYMPQKFGLYEDLSCMENMNLYADLHGISKEEREKRYDRLLTMTGLAPFTDRRAGQLSGGMKQKLGLACTLIRTPALLLLDEPTAGVDPLSRRELWEILKALVKDEDISLLVSTAYMEEAELCDTVYILHKGHILDKGTPEELRKKSEGFVYHTDCPDGIPPRFLQAALLDDTACIGDAVPERGGVRFTLKKGASLENVRAFSVFPGCADFCTALSFLLGASFCAGASALSGVGASGADCSCLETCASTSGWAGAGPELGPVVSVTIFAFSSAIRISSFLFDGMKKGPDLLQSSPACRDTSFLCL